MPKYRAIYEYDGPTESYSYFLTPELENNDQVHRLLVLSG